MYGAIFVLALIAYANAADTLNAAGFQVPITSQATTGPKSNSWSFYRAFGTATGPDGKTVQTSTDGTQPVATQQVQTGTVAGLGDSLKNLQGGAVPGFTNQWSFPGMQGGYGMNGMNSFPGYGGYFGGLGGFGQGGLGGFGNGFGGFGNGFGQQGFGQKGFGQQGFGQQGFGHGFGQQGFGQQGFGQQGFGAPFGGFGGFGGF